MTKTKTTERYEIEIDLLHKELERVKRESLYNEARWRDAAQMYGQLRAEIHAQQSAGESRFPEPLDLHELQKEIHKWEQKNFGDQPVERRLMGITEENGELNHAMLKMAQHIRGSKEEHTAAAKDAVGDMLVFTMNFCSAMGWDLETILRDTWNEVKQRDWTKNKESGE